MIGIFGDKFTPKIAEIFERTQAGGLILFRPNFKNAATFKNLIQSLERRIKRKLIIAVDHEGGRVIHLAEGITIFPDNLTLGKCGNARFAFEQGKIEAKELRRLGIDLNLAPTVDVLTKAHSPNIGIRSYGFDPGLVSKMASARIKGMQSLGLSACAKHFPGQGQSPKDAHLGLPVLKTSMAEMEKIHLQPFKAAIRAGVDAIMTSHPVYPAFDADLVPATFSRNIVHGLLRKKLDFKGLILSDDLEMGALRGYGSIGQCAVHAVQAGHDMVLICHDAKAAVQAYQDLEKAYENGELNQRELEESSQRIEALKTKRRNRFEGVRVYAEPAGKTLAEKIAKQAIRYRVQKGQVPEPVPFVPGTIAVIFPKLSELSSRIFIEKTQLNERKFIASLFRDKKISAKNIFLTALNPDQKEVGRAKVFLQNKNNDALLFFCYDAHLSQGNREILVALQKSKKKVGIILLRNPYDADLIKKSIPHIRAFGFRECQIRAAVKGLIPAL